MGCRREYIWQLYMPAASGLVVMRRLAHGRTQLAGQRTAFFEETRGLPHMLWVRWAAFAREKLPQKTTIARASLTRLAVGSQIYLLRPRNHFAYLCMRSQRSRWWPGRTAWTRRMGSLPSWTGRPRRAPRGNYFIDPTPNITLKPHLRVRSRRARWWRKRAAWTRRARSSPSWTPGKSACCAFFPSLHPPLNRSLIPHPVRAQPAGALVAKARSLDQARAVVTFLDAASEKTLRSTVALTAARRDGPETLPNPEMQKPLFSSTHRLGLLRSSKLPSLRTESTCSRFRLTHDPAAFLAGLWSRL